MANLKDLKIRIDSVKSTQKITSAMKMVAAAKLRKAQMSAEAARPFAERMERMAGGLAKSFDGVEGAPALLAGNGSDQNQLLVVESRFPSLVLHLLPELEHLSFRGHRMPALTRRY